MQDCWHWGNKTDNKPQVTQASDRLPPAKAINCNYVAKLDINEHQLLTSNQ